MPHVYDIVWPVLKDRAPTKTGYIFYRRRLNDAEHNVYAHSDQDIIMYRQAGELRGYISDAPRGMIKTADAMRESSRSKIAINSEVREILRAIESKIAEANKEGRNNTEFPIPKQYSAFPGDDDAALVINATIVRELKAANYGVVIRDIRHSLLLDIRWVAELTAAERIRMEKLLEEHMYRPPADNHGSDDNGSQSDDS